MNFFCFLVSVSVAPLVHQEGKITKTSKMFLLEHLHGKKVEYEICCMLKLFLLCTQMVELFQFKFLVDSLKLQDDFSKETSFFSLQPNQDKPKRPKCCEYLQIPAFTLMIFQKQMILLSLKTQSTVLKF